MHNNYLMSITLPVQYITWGWYYIFSQRFIHCHLCSILQLFMCFLFLRTRSNIVTSKLAVSLVWSLLLWLTYQVKYKIVQFSFNWMITMWPTSTNLHWILYGMLHSMCETGNNVLCFSKDSEFNPWVLNLEKVHIFI